MYRSFFSFFLGGGGGGCHIMRRSPDFGMDWCGARGTRSFLLSSHLNVYSSGVVTAKLTSNTPSGVFDARDTLYDGGVVRRY